MDKTGGLLKQRCQDVLRADKATGMNYYNGKDLLALFGCKPYNYHYSNENNDQQAGNNPFG